MKRTDEIQGERYPDWHFEGGALTPEMKPGGYMKVLDYPFDLGPTNLTQTTWAIVAPNGLKGQLTQHTVREEDDGSITVKPGDGSSNSILVTGVVYPEGWEPGDSELPTLSWHGYITRGLWWGLA